MSVSRLSIRRPVAVAMLFLAIVLLGGISFLRLPIDLLPDVAYPRLVIYTSYPDVAPAEVERFVSEPIEQVVAAVPGVERVESVSREGFSLVTLRFAWGTDMDFAVLNVREKLDNIGDQLPELAERPAVLRTDPNSDPILVVSVSGSQDLWTLKDLAETVFRRRLEQVDGVAQAAVAGGLEREIHVDVDSRRLEAQGLSIQDIAETLDAANQSAPGGTVLRGRYRYSLRTLGEFQSVDQIGEVALSRSESTDSAPAGFIKLSDVATIDDGFKERESIARYGGHEAIGLLVFKESGVNTVRVAEEVDQVLARLRMEYPEVVLDIAMSQAGFISESISNVVQALVLGGFLAFIVLFLFLRDWRYPVAIALAIPISVIGTFVLLDFAGVSLNIMSLGGLALGVGMLVDNSIVVLENIFRHREVGTDPSEAAGRGADEVRGAITASTLTTISVFGPIIYVEGVAGQLFRSVSLAVAFSLMVSLLVAITLLPMMAARWQPRVGRDTPSGPFAAMFSGFDRGFRRFADWYHRILEAALEQRIRVMGVAFLLLAGTIVLGTTLDRGVLPNVDQGAFTARLSLAPGTPLERTAETAAELERLFLSDPGVDAVFGRVGRQETLAGVEEEESGLHTAVLDIRLKEGAATETVLARLADQLADLPKGALAIETGNVTALGRLLGGGEADLAVRIRGDDLEENLRYAEALQSELVLMSSLVNVRVGTAEGQPEIVVDIDRERAAALDINPTTIAEAIEGFMRGTIATEFVDFDRKIPIVVRLPERERRALETLDRLTVNGVPLRELVRPRETIGPAEIRRLEQARTVAVYADVARGGLDAAITAVQSVVSTNPPPRGVRLEIGGDNEERARSFRDLAFAFGLALVLVYMILAAQFESFFQPFTILLAVPLAGIGAVAALWISSAGLNTMSLIGVVVLVGIVVNDAIIKVDFINQMRVGGMALRPAILEAGRVRLRPILMTTATTVLGLTPMALGIGRGADLRAPLAIAVIGGLLSATALTLIVVPVAYDLIDDFKHRVRGLIRMSPAHEREANGV